MTIDFGKSHWLLFGVSFFGFIVLAYLVGIGPAIWVSSTHNRYPDRLHRLRSRQGAQGLCLRGLRLLSHSASAAAEDGRSVGKALGPW